MNLTKLNRVQGSYESSAQYGLPSITWDVTNQLSFDSEEREATYEANGYDNFGSKYEGTAVYSCGELLSIEDVEKI